jgi:hypothetical protein
MSQLSLRDIAGKFMDFLPQPEWNFAHISNSRDFRNIPKGGLCETQFAAQVQTLKNSRFIVMVNNHYPTQLSGCSFVQFVKLAFGLLSLS